MTNMKDGVHSYEMIAPDTYRIDEKGLVNCYLLLGETKALLIDSGVGIGDILGSVRELTSLPVTLALTHRHCDHAGGRNAFPDYFVHKADKPAIIGLLSSKLACNVLLKANKVTDFKLTKKPYHSHAHYFDESFTLDLGGRSIRILSCPGHTPGSVVYLDDKTHLMFTGDDVNPYLWMQLPGCTSLSTWLVKAQEILKLADTYTPYGGHGTGLLSKEQISKTVSLVQEILATKPEFKGKALDYPLDPKSQPRILVARKNIR